MVKFLHWFFMRMFTEFPDNKSKKRREARFGSCAQGLCPRSWVVRESSARGAREDYVVPFPGSRARKLAAPAGFQATKMIFEVFQSQRSFFLVSKTPLVDVQRLFMVSKHGFSGVHLSKINFSRSLLPRHLLEAPSKRFGSA